MQAEAICSESQAIVVYIVVVERRHGFAEHQPGQDWDAFEE